MNWIVITGGNGGTGAGTVTYNVLANPGSVSRSATLTIAGQPFTVTQAGQGCNFSLSPTSTQVGVNGGSGSFNITMSGSDCSWTAASNASWASVTGTASGQGSGTVSYQAAGNPSAGQRTGTITVTAAGTTAAFTITEAGGTCVYTLPQGSQTFLASGGTGTATIVTEGGCAWTASNSGAPFVTITSGNSGSGTGVVSFTVPPYSGNATPRSGS